MKTKYLKTSEGTIIATDSPQYWKECETLPQAKGKAAYIEQERQQLLKWLQPGSTVYTVLRHVSSSGMPRRISCFIVLDGAIQDISGWVSTVS
jgi:hypothetical protein